MRRAPSQDRSRQRVDRILSAAATLIVEQGIDAVRMSEIASRASISIGSLYQYFPNKTAVVVRLTAELNEEGRACVAAELSQVREWRDLRPALLRIIDGFHSMYVDRPDYHAIWMATQGDKHLQALDNADGAMHAGFLAATLERVTGRPPEDVWPVAMMLTNQIASGVRGAVSADATIRDAMLAGLKRLMPSDPRDLLP